MTKQFPGIRNNQKDESLRFLNELDRAVPVVTAYPRIAAEIEPDIRSFFFRRFPYSLIYGIDGNTIVVIAGQLECFTGKNLASENESSGWHKYDRKENRHEEAQKA